MKSLLAAICLFTRVPVARFLPENYLGREHYSRAILWWPVVGLLVGLVVALTLFVLAKILPLYVAVLVTIVVRVLLTGAMHEDGLADFCDGFGGAGAGAGSGGGGETQSTATANESQSTDATESKSPSTNNASDSQSTATASETQSTATASEGQSADAAMSDSQSTGALTSESQSTDSARESQSSGRERILAIMKDSHIGTYGVIALILYFLLLASEIGSITEQVDMRAAAVAIISAEFISRATSLWLVATLPYARREEESKVGFLYTRPTDTELVVMSLVSILPLILFLGLDMIVVLPLPIVGIFVLRNYIKRKIGGYTGDCCGASVLIIEQLFYLGFIILFVVWR